MLKGPLVIRDHMGVCMLSFIYFELLGGSQRVSGQLRFRIICILEGEREGQVTDLYRVVTKAGPWSLSW